jgi:hypothetical protein
MQKKGEEDKEDDTSENKELTSEEKEILKKLEKGELDLADTKKTGPINKDPKYVSYTEMGYEVDLKKGLIYRDNEMISRQRKVILFLLKSIGSNIMRGKSLMNVSLPVTIFDKASLLERSASDYIYAPVFAEKMFEAEDPVEKMKYAVTLTIASLHMNISQKKPFNPILGETYQGTIGNLNVYCEQTSHHPPISHLLLDCDHYTIDAKHQFTLSTYPNSAVMKCVGYRRIVLKDAARTTYLIDFPWAECTGFMFGNRVLSYKGNIRIRDKTNKIYAQVRLQAGEKSFAEGIRKTEARNDFFKGLITKNKALLKDMSRKAFYSKDMLSYIEGNWIDYVMIDGDKFWEIDKQLPGTLARIPDPLPSDSKFRMDLQTLITSTEEEAQKQKEIMEEIQRKDRKLREQFGPKK